MDEISKVVRDYIIREYVQEGDDREVTETTAADFQWPRGFLFHGISPAIPGKRVCDSHSRRRRDNRGFRYS